jgi:hypothetical protein
LFVAVVVLVVAVVACFTIAEIELFEVDWLVAVKSTVFIFICCWFFSDLSVVLVTSVAAVAASEATISEATVSAAIAEASVSGSISISEAFFPLLLDCLDFGDSVLRNSVASCLVLFSISNKEVSAVLRLILKLLKVRIGETLE